MNEAKPIRVLFVCTGNICRSPMAEGIFRYLVNLAGLTDQFEIDSAGTSDYHVGEATYLGTVTTLRNHGISFSTTSRAFRSDDVTTYDYIIAMDRSHFDHIMRAKQALNGTAQVALLLDYTPNYADKNVPDPYYVTHLLEPVYTMIRSGSEELLKAIRAERDLP
ncbi:MAG TPA: low molecular weight protein-tyrosine-phosphatase [Aggregatilineales bacterium]|nr:low molecular weight phosphotyrosine protein phosphatase [Anaerolineales bacterium]HRE48563.1 low molecular weight protein-tyrosine-phosphatase [Aggregatilineales bacterium]